MVSMHLSEPNLHLFWGTLIQDTLLTELPRPVFNFNIMQSLFPSKEKALPYDKEIIESPNGHYKNIYKVEFKPILTYLNYLKKICGHFQSLTNAYGIMSFGILSLCRYNARTCKWSHLQTREDLLDWPRINLLYSS